MSIMQAVGYEKLLALGGDGVESDEVLKLQIAAFLRESQHFVYG